MKQQLLDFITCAVLSLTAGALLFYLMNGYSF
jgi:hypothetical protein